MAKPIPATAFSNYLRAHSQKGKPVSKKRRATIASARRRNWEAMNGPVEVRKA